MKNLSSKMKYLKLRIGVTVFLPYIFLCLTVSISAADDSLIAKELIKKAGISKGICSIPQCKDADLAIAIAKNSEFFVHVMAEDWDTVYEIQKAVDKENLLGSRIVVEKGSVNSIPFADNYVDLVVVPKSTKVSGLQRKEIIRALRPRGKIIVRAASGGWTTEEKPPIEGVDDWRHWQHEPDNNPASTDTQIKMPYMLQWIDKPYQLPTEVVTTAAAGRIFTVAGAGVRFPELEEAKNLITARNGYNGTILWQRKLYEGYKVHRSAYIATEDTYYLIERNNVLLLDPETGKVKETLQLTGGNEELKWIALHNNKLFALAGPTDTVPVKGGLPISYMMKGKKLTWLYGNRILAHDLKSNKKVWDHKESAEIDSRAMGIKDNKLFFYMPEHGIVCLSIETGKTIWKQDDDQLLKDLAEPRNSAMGGIWRTAVSMLCIPDIVLVDSVDSRYIAALSSKTGNFLWKVPKHATKGMGRLLFTNNKLYASRVAQGTGYTILDLGTGESSGKYFGDHTCARANVCPDAFFTRSVAGRYEGQRMVARFSMPMRASCFDGILPANGLLYLTPMACSCYTNITGTISLASRGSFKTNHLATEKNNLDMLPAGKSKASNLKIDDNDWAMYRANKNSTGSTKMSIAENVKKLWEIEDPTEYLPSAPSTAGKYIYVGGSDNKLKCIDAESGKIIWQYSTAGYIQKPPSIWKGNAYIGSNDGYIYCIDAVTGKLRWRFRAAPVERRIMVYRSLNSTWPVTTGVFINEGVAYAAAGILGNNGTYVYALDALTGKIKWQNNKSGQTMEGKPYGVSVLGGLVSVNEQLVMGAGVSIISPAFYSLSDGSLLNDAKPRARSGAPSGAGIGIFDKYLVCGGKILYSNDKKMHTGRSPTRENVAFLPLTENRGKVNLWITLVRNSKILPVWDDKGFVFLSRAHNGLVYWDNADLVALLDAKAAEMASGSGKKGSRKPAGRTPRNVVPEKIKWGPLTHMILSMAIAKNAIVVTGSTDGKWVVTALDRKTGDTLWQEELPVQPLIDGIAINRDGKIIISLINGMIVCFG